MKLMLFRNVEPITIHGSLLACHNQAVDASNSLYEAKYGKGNNCLNYFTLFLLISEFS